MSELSKIIKEAREAKGWSQADLARAADVSQQTVAKIENGLTTRSRYLPVIAGALGLAIPSMGIYGRSEQQRPDEPASERRETTLADQIPVFATSYSANGQIFRAADDPIEFVVRPTPLRAARGYGLYLVQQDMAPAFDPGDIAIIHESLPPVPMSYCAFFTEPNEAGLMRVLVRRLLSIDPGGYRVMKFSPEGEEHLDAGEWVRVQRVIARFSRL